ncbi:MAG TPA: hypothetical protein VH186_06625 [Chloroflexia bacterium]|nr:hypothetical protein [Chloroflexia bacterium]
MTEIVSWSVTILVIILLVATLIYLYGLLKLPLFQRPKTPTYDRFGDFIGETQNPDYHVMPGTDKAAEPDKQSETKSADKQA